MALLEMIHQLEAIARTVLISPDVFFKKATSGDWVLRLHGFSGAAQEFSGPEKDAFQLLQRYRQCHMSWRTLKRLPRTCTWADVVNVRRQLTLYHAKTASFQAGYDRPRAFCWVQLSLLLKAQMESVVALGDIGAIPSTGKVKVIFCADATPLRTSATQAIISLNFFD